LIFTLLRQLDIGKSFCDEMKPMSLLGDWLLVGREILPQVVMALPLEVASLGICFCGTIVDLEVEF